MILFSNIIILIIISVKDIICFFSWNKTQSP